MPISKEMGIITRSKQPAKAVYQVITALKNLKSINGPTMMDIVKYIFAANHKPSTKCQIMTALKRAIEFGLIKRNRGHYLISSPDEDLTNLSNSSSRLTRFRELPKFSDKVTKRMSIMKMGRRKYSNSSRNGWKVASRTSRYNSKQDSNYA
ncbi:PREDICTED: uncharacterized protein LOC105364136 [Ceratosolen solmsi marchali]|uniref:Uncharacterized protein LOC105364136 n=1 Tax=Ceratosolen solmsi marchali TaxID=326594 RepID=A0AAJ6YLI4_9HYME|nr:PREDICTED: uncharacterized protein LOC105364136 [Ceratosolen solmsi marchali]